MIFWNKEYQRQKISRRKAGSREYQWLNKEKGQLQWVTGLFFILLLLLVTCTQLQVESYCTTALYLEDTLAASNLASAVIDLQEYGSTHVIRIADPVAAYDIFCDAVKTNLHLGEAWQGGNTELVSGQVKILQYIVYNVENDVVKVYQRQEDGSISEWESGLGSVYAPNGQEIENTSIYSEISFPVRGIFGIEVEANKGKLVDIVVNSE